MTDFTKEMFEDILDALALYGFYDDEIEFHEQYSGRGMYGATVNAIELNRNSGVTPYHIGLAVGNLVSTNPRWKDVNPLKLFRRQDSLGLGSILY